MRPFLSMAAVAAAATVVAVAPALSQATTPPPVPTQAHAKSHIKARSGQRPPGWRASEASSSSATSSSASSSIAASDDGASNSPTPYPPTLRPANFYAHDAAGTGGKTMYPDPRAPKAPASGATPLTERPYPDPLCAPRPGAGVSQPHCPGQDSGTSAGSADSRAPDK